MVGVRAEKLDRHIDRNARSRTDSQSQRILNIEPPIQSFWRREFFLNFFLFFSRKSRF